MQFDAVDYDAVSERAIVSVNVDDTYRMHHINLVFPFNGLVIYYTVSILCQVNKETVPVLYEMATLSVSN